MRSLEKQLRDAAAAEVAVHGLYGNEENGDKASRKRKHMNADEKAKQKYVLRSLRAYLLQMNLLLTEVSIFYATIGM